MIHSNSTPQPDELRAILTDLSDTMEHLPQLPSESVSSNLQAIARRLEHMVEPDEGAPAAAPAARLPGVDPAKFDLLSRVAPGIIYEWDLQSGVVLRSPGLTLILGYAAGCVPSNLNGWHALIHPVDQTLYLSQLSRALDSAAESYDLEYRVRRADGHWAHIWDRAAIVRDARGSAVRVVGICTDISQHKGLETLLTNTNRSLAVANEALRENETRLRVAIANAPVAVFANDLELRYTWFYSPYMGHSAEHMVGKRDDEVLPYSDVSDLIACKLAALEQGSLVRREIQLKVGEVNRQMVVTLDPLRDADGTVVGLIGSALDVTEQRMLEAQQVEYTARMEVQRRLFQHRELERQQIARDLHDGPIQELGALAFTIQMLQEINDPQETADKLTEIRQQVRGLIGELRGVCNDLRPPALGRFGLTGAIQSYIEDFREKHPGVDTSLGVIGSDKPTADPPSPTQPGRLPDDVSLALFRIFQESLNNTLRHASASEITVVLVFSPDQVRLDIQDNGSGFAADQVDWVELVHQGHFGLVGMKERAEAVGGTLVIFSHPGEGVTIRVLVPR